MGVTMMKIIAHRGASAYATENTMPAFKKAVEWGVSGIETDIRLTKDGIPVLHHDPTIKRLTGNKNAVANLTLAELETYSFKKKGFLFRKGGSIVTLNQFLSFIQDFPSITLHLEIKKEPELANTIEERVIDCIHMASVKNQIIYSSFNHTSLHHIWELAPHSQIALLFTKQQPQLFDYISHLSMPIKSIHPKHTLITLEMIEQAHQRGIAVNPFTVNKKRRARTCKQMGVDGLITDHPLIAKRL